MLAPAQEFRRKADNCLSIARTTHRISAKMALVEMATEFRALAEHFEREATVRRAERIRRRVASLLRNR
jgi:hypothetical protein